MASLRNAYCSMAKLNRTLGEIVSSRLLWRDADCSVAITRMQARLSRAMQWLEKRELQRLGRAEAKRLSEIGRIKRLVMDEMIALSGSRTTYAAGRRERLHRWLESPFAWEP